MLIREINKILKAKCSKLFFIYISYDSCWAFASGLLHPNLFFLDNVHLMEKGNLKLAASILCSIENCNGVTYNKHKQFLISYRMAVSFNETTLTFPFYLFLLYLSLLPLFLLRHHLLLHAVLPVMLVLFLINLSLSLSDPANVCDGTVCLSDVHSSKPIRCSELVCSSSVRLSTPTISKNFNLNKPVCLRNISFSRSICSSKFAKVEVMLVK